MTKRWPDYWDLCLQCRYAGLDNVADFIHAMMDNIRTYESRVSHLEQALLDITKAQYNADSKDIANKALEAKSASFKTKIKLESINDANISWG